VTFRRHAVRVMMSDGSPRWDGLLWCCWLLALAPVAAVGVCGLGATRDGLVLVGVPCTFLLRASLVLGRRAARWLGVRDGRAGPATSVRLPSVRSGEAWWVLRRGCNLLVCVSVGTLTVGCGATTTSTLAETRAATSAPVASGAVASIPALEARTSPAGPAGQVVNDAADGIRFTLPVGYRLGAASSAQAGLVAFPKVLAVSSASAETIVLEVEPPAGGPPLTDQEVAALVSSLQAQGQAEASVIRVAGSAAARVAFPDHAKGPGQQDVAVKGGHGHALYTFYFYGPRLVAADEAEVLSSVAFLPSRP